MKRYWDRIETPFGIRTCGAYLGRGNESGTGAATCVVEHFGHLDALREKLLPRGFDVINGQQ